MRACWIDTSFMFRTVEGFFETARTVLTHHIDKPATWDEAKLWARHEAVDIVPNSHAEPIAVAK